MTIPALLKYDEIKSQLGMWAKTAKEQDLILHTLAVQTLLHAEKHGDCSLVGFMFDNLPASFKVRYLNRWVNQYSPVVYGNSKKGESKVWRLATKDEEAFKAFDIEGALANPFFNAIPKETPEDLTMGAIVAQIKRNVTTLRKAITEGKYKGNTESALKFIGKLEPAIELGNSVALADANDAVKVA